MANEYRRFWITSRDSVERECLLADAFEAGAEGAEEVEDGSGFRACIYADATRIEEIHDLIGRSSEPGTIVEEIELVPEVDWSEAWKEGLDAIVISKRLVVRPPFAEHALETDQIEIVIDPGQAFGIGGHASTRLCLEWIDALVLPADLPEFRPAFDRVLDVGTGSGVLALAAVALGAEIAIGFDLDSVATVAARAAAIRNDLTSQVNFFTGGIESLGSHAAKFRLVIANLLKQEMLPIASEISESIAGDGRLLLAGLLEEDVAEVMERFEQDGLIEVGRRSLKDSTGEWVGLCMAFAD